MTTDTLPPADPIRYEQWLDEVLRLREGARIRKIHPDTLKKEAEAKGELLRLSARVLGVRRRFALLKD